nr:MAG TPA: hypothetical protein [Caudoviricetes sp.]
MLEQPQPQPPKNGFMPAPNVVAVGYRITPHMALFSSSALTLSRRACISFCWMSARVCSPSA